MVKQHTDKESYYRVLGLMSGTSLDGVDLALCRFTMRNRTITHYTIEKAHTYPYPSYLIKQLSSLLEACDSSIEEVDRKLGKYYAAVIQDFLLNIPMPDLIASHGHTVYHEPEINKTLQIGNGNIMAQKTGITVVNDFRSEDIRLGGQGAPLVPVGDELLFSSYPFCLNLGGFANLSFVHNGIRVACDLAPCNMLINNETRLLGFPYDEDGKLAQKGDLNNLLFEELNGLPYYRKSHPKSLGKEWFVNQVIPVLRKYYPTGHPDAIRTATQHAGYQVGHYIENYRESNEAVLVTGGGAHNSYLLHHIQSVTGTRLVVPDRETVEFKEALVFALLGLLRYKGINNVYASVTGATRNSCSGVIHNP